MREICTEVRIKGSVDRVWECLTNFDSYFEWNPFLRKVTGKPTLGTILKIYVRFAPGLTVRMKTKVLIADPRRKFCFIGKLPLPGLLSGEHSWEIAELNNGLVKLSQREIYRGVLTPIFFFSLEKTLGRGFNAMDIALKKRVENQR